MNETVKAALLWEAMGARNTIENCDQDIAAIKRRLAHAETKRAEQVARLSDIELHLKDNGVDLAAVDAEAEKARPVVNLGGQHSLVGQQASLQRDSLGQVDTGLGQALSSFGRDGQFANQYDPTAGLAKALDEA